MKEQPEEFFTAIDEGENTILHLVCEKNIEQIKYKSLTYGFGKHVSGADRGKNGPPPAKPNRPRAG